jgi:hypothetical protein
MNLHFHNYFSILLFLELLISIKVQVFSKGHKTIDELFHLIWHLISKNEWSKYGQIFEDLVNLNFNFFNLYQKSLEILCIFLWQKWKYPARFMF